MFYAFEEFGIIYAFRVQKNNKIECVLLFIIYNPINSKLYCVTFHNFIVSHFTILLCSLADLHRRSHEIGLNCAQIPRANIQLGVRGLGTNLQVSIAKCLADGVNTNMVSRL